MKTSQSIQHFASYKIAYFVRLVMLLTFLVFPISSAEAQNGEHNKTKELYNEMMGVSIWISPSTIDRQAMHITTQYGVEFDLSMGGLTFNGTTRPSTQYSGSSRFGSSSNVDERTITLRPDGSFDYRGGAVSSYGWSESGMSTGFLPSDDGSGLYGLYREPTSGEILVMFLYFDGRWGFGTMNANDQFDTDKGQFHRQ